MAFTGENRAWSAFEREREVLDCEWQGFASLLLQLAPVTTRRVTETLPPALGVPGASDSIETLIPPPVIFNRV